MPHRALFQTTVFIILACLFLAPGCAGRSGLDVFIPADGGTADVTTPAVCNASTCVNGCCDANRVCQPGGGSNACGTLGQACRDCVATGFESCDPVVHACETNVGQCNAASCSGCCTGNVCFTGKDPNVCGSGGQACLSCASTGLVCTAQQCVPPPPPPPCGPTNCKGCCAGQVCELGTVPTSCGRIGGQCADCSTLGAPASCVANAGGGGSCQPLTPPVCSPANCPTGCCDTTGNCQPGFTAPACGNLGNACQNCVGMGAQCVGQQCSACNLSNCDNGCCNALGVCRPGDVDTECGGSSSTCQDCTQFGEQCSGGPPQCMGASCNQRTCPFGCCDPASDTCQPGSLNSACGNHGESCDTCSPLLDQQCVSQQCDYDVDAGAVCSSTTCPTGCCDLVQDQCQQGVTGLQCGTLGADCVNCLEYGKLCSASQQCVPPPGNDAGAVCNQQTCPFGCCDASGICQQGSLPTQCGFMGSLCLDCTKLGGQCLGQSCTTADGGATCQGCYGCCDASGNCQGGFLSTQCGEEGARCRDCTMLNPASTCDVTVSPRVCASQQTQCPGPYPSCPTPLEQAAPSPQKACSTADLQNAAAACSGGANTTACNNFFGYGNSACGNCLQPFDIDFVAQGGIRACVAPYVDATCNHNSACIVDCTAESCFGCADSATTLQCETQVPSGTCATYTQADTCVATALAGPAAICNPVTYQGNFGAWLQGVGAKYCGP